MNLAMVGHNQDPDAKTALEEYLRENNEVLLKQVDAIEVEAGNFPDEFDSVQAEIASDFIKKLAKNAKEIEDVRKDEKEPFLTSGRTVDGFFSPFTARLDGVKKSVQARLTAYLQKVAALERARLAEEQERLRKESEAKAKAASALDEAGLAEDASLKRQEADDTALAAQKAQQASMARPSALAGSRGTSGYASLKTRSVGRILNRNELDLELLRPYLSMDDLQKALNAFVKAGNTEIKGAIIEQISEAQVR